MASITDLKCFLEYYSKNRAVLAKAQAEKPISVQSSLASLNRQMIKQAYACMRSHGFQTSLLTRSALDMATPSNWDEHREVSLNIKPQINSQWRFLRYNSSQKPLVWGCMVK